jgi:hypothetical protein
MKRAIFLATVCLLTVLIFASVALAAQQEATPATPPGPLAPSGGPAILLPAAALLLGSGILTYAILRRR